MHNQHVLYLKSPDHFGISVGYWLTLSLDKWPNWAGIINVAYNRALEVVPPLQNDRQHEFDKIQKGLTFNNMDKRAIVI